MRETINKSAGKLVWKSADRETRAVLPSDAARVWGFHQTAQNRLHLHHVTVIVIGSIIDVKRDAHESRQQRSLTSVFNNPISTFRRLAVSAQYNCGLC